MMSLCHFISIKGLAKCKTKKIDLVFFHSHYFHDDYLQKKLVFISIFYLTMKNKLIVREFVIVSVLYGFGLT